VAGPPGLGNDKIQPKRGKVVRERVHVHIAHLTLQTVTTGQASLDWPPSTSRRQATMTISLNPFRSTRKSAQNDMISYAEVAPL
jgi:hypothetical protein